MCGVAGFIVCVSVPVWYIKPKIPLTFRVGLAEKGKGCMCVCVCVMCVFVYMCGQRRSEQDTNETY